MQHAALSPAESESYSRVANWLVIVLEKRRGRVPDSFTDGGSLTAQPACLLLHSSVLAGPKARSSEQQEDDSRCAL